eukprot:s905_g10.t1
MASSSGMPKPGGGEALVAFFTKLPEKFQVPEEELVIPANLERYGLSEVVNRLIGHEQPIPFDFLVEGEFLRSSIGTYLEVHKLSAEKVLRLEFVLALREPEQSSVDEAPEWISSVVALEAYPSTWFAATLYDGTVRIYEGSEMRLSTRFLRGEVARLRRRPAEGQAGARGGGRPSRDSRTPSSEDLNRHPDPPTVHLEVSHPRPSAGNPGSSTAPTPSASPLTWTQREAVCDQISEFILRALSGDHRRTSGRELIKLGSRVWLIFRDFDGYEHNPVTVCRSFASCKSLVKRGSDCGESVFIGLPSDREARRVVAGVGLDWPSDS